MGNTVIRAQEMPGPVASSREAAAGVEVGVGEEASSCVPTALWTLGGDLD